MHACNVLMKIALLPKRLSTDWILNIVGQNIPDLIKTHPKEYVLRYFYMYVKCMNNPTVTSVINKCFESVPYNCQQSNVIATKTIRLYMKHLEPMLQKASRLEGYSSIKGSQGNSPIPEKPVYLSEKGSD